MKKDFASRCRRLASLPNETFERAINEADIKEWGLVQRDDLDELQGNIDVLCSILGNELLDWIKAESQYDNQSAVGAKTIP